MSLAQTCIYVVVGSHSEDRLSRSRPKHGLFVGQMRYSMTLNTPKPMVTYLFRYFS
jgi:hypothetical protein